MHCTHAMCDVPSLFSERRAGSLERKDAGIGCEMGRGVLRDIGEERVACQ